MWPHITAKSEVYVTLFFDMWLLNISHPSVKFDSHMSRENEFKTFFICYMTLCEHQSTGYVTLWIIGRHSVKFFSHRSSRSRNVTFFISLVITWSRAQSVKRLDGWWSFIINLYLFKFGSHSPEANRVILFFICHMTSCGHVITGSRDFAGCSPSVSLPSLPSVVVIFPLMEVEIWSILIFNVRRRIRMIILLQSETMQFDSTFDYAILGGCSVLNALNLQK